VNETALAALPVECVDRIAVHETGHLIGLTDEGRAGDAMSPILPPGCSVPAALSGTPVSLTASVSGSTVTLTWTAPSSGDAPTAYMIEAGTSSGASNLVSFSTG